METIIAELKQVAQANAKVVKSFFTKPAWDKLTTDMKRLIMKAHGLWIKAPANEKPFGYPQEESHPDAIQWTKTKTICGYCMRSLTHKTAKNCPHVALCNKLHSEALNGNLMHEAMAIKGLAATEESKVTTKK